MIEGRNIICVASNWFYDPTSKHHVMRLLSEWNHIVWVNYHASRRPGLSRADARAVAAKVRQIVEGPRRVAENITVVTPLVVPLPGNRTVAALNRRLLVRQIRSVLRGLPDRPVQLWSFAPDVDYLCGALGEEAVIYYCVDDFGAFSGYDAVAVRTAESRLARRADLVITTSRALYEAKLDLNENVVLVTHGVDFEHFARARAPETVAAEEVARLPRPVLGFWGMIQDWLDVELLAEVALARPGWSIVLIGEVLADVSAFSGLSNVHLLGRKPYERLPSYARGFDVGLIPFRVNALTRAVNPIKLREYLSAGLPVVSTDLPEVRGFGELVSIASDARGFVRACESVLPPDVGGVGCGAGRARVGVAERQAAMRGETWSAKVVEISAHVARSLGRGGGVGEGAAGSVVGFPAREGRGSGRGDGGKFGRFGPPPTPP